MSPPELEMPVIRRKSIMALYVKSRPSKWPDLVTFHEFLGEIKFRPSRVIVSAQPGYELAGVPCRVHEDILSSPSNFGHPTWAFGG